MAAVQRDHRMMATWKAVTIIFYIAFIVNSSAQETKLCKKEDGKRLERNAIDIRKLSLGMQGVTFTWQATRGTSNLIIEHTNDVMVSVEDKGHQLEITAVGGSLNGANIITMPTNCLLFVLSSVLFWPGKKWATIIAVLILVLYSTTLAGDGSCNDVKGLHLLIPSELVEEICTDGSCFPVLCKLSLISEYSNMPSNNRMVFEDNSCTVAEPPQDVWTAWLTKYFGEDTAQDYLGDFDGDGLVNILEYHGPAAFDGTFLIMDEENLENAKRSERQSSSVSVEWNSTDPTHPDTDGDLLQDGFELANILDPLATDPLAADYDNDSLSNLDEQIMKTDPLNADSDGDGVSDGEEAQNGANPINPADRGRMQPNEQVAAITLTVGDHSGSHSERYILHVGDISHQSPGYGLVGSGTYTFRPGTYRITLQHYGTKKKKVPTATLR